MQSSDGTLVCGHYILQLFPFDLIIKTLQSAIKTGNVPLELLIRKHENYKTKS